jgi:hypothetical protein
MYFERGEAFVYTNEGRAKEVRKYEGIIVLAKKFKREFN